LGFLKKIGGVLNATKNAAALLTQAGSLSLSLTLPSGEWLKLRRSALGLSCQ
jgi:hypothetical protein